MEGDNAMFDIAKQRKFERAIADRAAGNREPIRHRLIALNKQAVADRVPYDWTDESFGWSTASGAIVLFQDVRTFVTFAPTYMGRSFYFYAPGYPCEQIAAARAAAKEHEIELMEPWACDTI